MKQRPAFWNHPFRIFVLSMILASVGLVVIYSTSASYADRQERNALKRNLIHQYGQEEGARIAKQRLAEDHDYHDPRYLQRQMIWIGLGLVFLFLAYRIDYRRLKDIAPWLLALSFVLLLAVYIPGIKVVINNHHRWIGAFGFTFQPSELAKLALVIYMARMLTDRHEQLKSFIRGVVPAMLVTGVFAGLIVLEPDIGAATVLTTIIFLMWFVGGMRIRHMIGLGIAMLPAFCLAVWHYRDRLERILAWVMPSAETQAGKGFQLNQSLIAIGSGGMDGVGLGNSMQKYWLTEQFSDFIFAIVCEELGFIGAALIVLCFFLLIWEGYRVALHGPDFFATLLASGLTLMLAINTTVNLMVVTGLLPTKGLVLPFLSYGGSNILVTMTGMGILMNIGRYVEEGRGSTVRRRGRTKSSRPVTRRNPARPRRAPFSGLLGR